MKKSTKLYVSFEAFQLTITFCVPNSCAEPLVFSANNGGYHQGVKHPVDRNAQIYDVIEMVEEHFQKFLQLTQ